VKRTSILILFAVFVFLPACSKSKNDADGRRLNVGTIPDDAQLIQGIDTMGSRVWVSWKMDNPQAKTYRCSVYNMAGRVISTGIYKHMKPAWDPAKGKMRYQPVQQLGKYLDCFYYGGIGISLRDKTVLMPAGSIDYPDERSGGLTVVYDGEGNKLSATQY
jgi:hypothetical protein